MVEVSYFALVRAIKTKTIVPDWQCHHIRGNDVKYFGTVSFRHCIVTHSALDPSVNSAERRGFHSGQCVFSVIEQPEIIRIVMRTEAMRVLSSTLVELRCLQEYKSLE